RAERVPDRAQHVAREERSPENQEISMRAQVAELVAAVEIAEFRLLGRVRIEREPVVLRREVRRVTRSELARIQALGRVPTMGEERREAAADVPAARDRAEVVDVAEDVELRERLEHAQIEGGRADPAPGERKADGTKLIALPDRVAEGESAPLGDVAA